PSHLRPARGGTPRLGPVLGRGASSVGGAAAGELTARRYNPVMQTVHVRVTDAATNRPTAVRLSVTGPDGTYYAPFGNLAEFATGRGEEVGGNLLLGRDRFAYIDGGCEIRLPARVPLAVVIEQGPDYSPVRPEATLAQ